MANSYLVVIDGKPEGPFTTEQLKQMRVTPATFVKTAEMNDYKEAHEVSELRELLGFDKISVQPQYFATLDQRLLAVIIDYVIVLAIHAFILSFLISTSRGQDQQGKISTAIIVFMLAPFTKIGYAAIMESSGKQATYGKLLLGLKVCDDSGSRISMKQALIRNLAKLVSKLTLGIGYFSGFFDKRQQCLHDKIAGTLVIKDRLI